MKRTITALTIATAFTIPIAWAATVDQRQGSSVANMDQWESVAFSDACMNGDVPELGYYSTPAADQRS